MEFPIHRIHFYGYTPVPFTCIAAADSGLLATGRQDGSIEVYDRHRNFFMVARIPSTVTKSVEALSWIGPRLFYTGALGRLVEVDLDTFSVKDTLLLMGNPISRCLSSCGSYLVIGNDEGFISICSTESSSVSLVQTLPQLTGIVTVRSKILSLACIDAKEKLLAAGTSSGTLMVICFTNTSYSIRHTLLSESKDTFVWVLLFSRTSLFSGDNKGNVCVWDVTVGGLLHTFPSHYAHVLALTASPDGQTVFSGGADALVRRYERFLSEDNCTQWELGGTIRGCRRDIRGLVYLAGQNYDPASQATNLDTRFEPHRLLAVGLDARLQVLACEQPERGLDAFARAHRTLACQVGRPRDSKIKSIAHVAALPFWPLACAATRPSPCEFVSVEHSNEQRPPTRLCLLRYPDKLDLVRLAQIDDKRKRSQAHRFLPISNSLLQLAEIRPRKGLEIIASTLSKCGSFVAYSDMVRTRILRVTISPVTVEEERRGVLPSVSVSRIQWEQNDRKRKSVSRRRLSPSARTNSTDSLTESSRIHGSSSETDTDTDDLSAASVAKFFALDQTIGSVTSVENNTSDVFPTPIKHQPDINENALPSSSCLTFTDDSQHLIQVLRASAELICVDVQTGNENWRRDLISESGSVFRVHLLSVSKSVGTGVAVVAIGCSDGRVRLYSTASGQQLLTCPCVASSSGYSPLPACLAFSVPRSGELDLSILYTNSQLSEWHLSLSKLNCPDDASCAVPNRDLDRSAMSATFNMWLSDFWNKMEEEVHSNLGLFHSLAYVDSDNWLLASDRYLVLLTRNKPFFRGMITKRLRTKDELYPESCMRICTNFESIIQAAVVEKNELAIVALHSAQIALKLSAPMQRKPFGT
ncbi:WD domain, G-beta repeat protein [Opisthorchis viverrini]|uniref:WD domain, G-beta repeat protein n=1 Tax=Opisthorchis viverrini TaxID=6198 RepID=A0A1S8WRZ0_OPIVI|nr:WD domain, G-beta repeat protein [Opisthorchis viverrini]